MKYNEKKGNLFELDKKYALVHCISLDCQMEEGIAKEFDKRFRGMKSFLKNEVKNYDMAFPVTIPFFKNDELRVFNLITKKVYHGRPTYETITKCIERMSELCIIFNIKYLAMPKIGCGLDRLQWGMVREIIQRSFKKIEIEIEVRYL